MAEQDDDELTPEELEQRKEIAQARKRKRLIALAAALSVLIVASIGGTLALLKMLEDDPDAELSAREETGYAAVYYTLRPAFVSSYQIRGRQRQLQVELALMLRDESKIARIEQHMPSLRNNVLMVLSGQVYEELRTPEGKELLRQELLQEIRDILTRELGEPVVEQVLFTGFVMQ
ncbi:flagellar basal body-associated FliL family protein [Marinimicrobium alkaliphilum]|uniref:flagellar basal body-associated FliL family protein n=1 Tax=Marinimicrobium alkaliphilum TaxID=2202654 RepID=UPI000DB9DECA|nr:flagellar basal body-associated FliL family protein [Marinimicrobium alkaliphilum]